MKSIKVNAVLNTMKTVCNIIFPIITVPYVTRVLGAANYGKVSYSNSIVSYFALFAALGIANYAQREGPRIRDDQKAINQFASEVFTINFISTIISYICLAILLIFSTKLRNYQLLILIQSSSILLMTLGTDWVNSVYEDYLYISVRYLIFQIIAILSLFLFVRNPNDYIIYASISVFASAGENVLNMFFVRRYVKIHFAPLRACKKHIVPTLKLFAIAVTTVIYVSSDITILGIFRGDKEVGIYTVSSKIYSTFKTVLSAIMMVSIPRLAFYLGHQKYKEYNALIKQIFNYFVTFLLPTICGLFMLSRQIMVFMSGPEYASGTVSLQILSISLFCSMFATLFAAGILLTYKMDNVYLVATIVSSLVNIVLNFILIPYMGMNGAALTTLLAEFLMMVITAHYSLKIESISEHKKEIFATSNVMISSILGAAGIVIECLLIRRVIPNLALQIIASFIIGVVLYCIILMLFKNPILDYVLRSLKQKLKRS